MSLFLSGKILQVIYSLFVAKVRVFIIKNFEMHSLIISSAISMYLTNLRVSLENSLFLFKSNATFEAKIFNHSVNNEWTKN